MSSGEFVVQCKELFSCGFPFQTDTVCCVNVPVVAGMFFHAQVQSEEWDLARRGHARLGGCSLIALHRAELAAPPAVGADFGLQSLHSRCHDFCWIKTNLRDL